MSSSAPLESYCKSIIKGREYFYTGEILEEEEKRGKGGKENMGYLLLGHKNLGLHQIR